MLSYSTRNCNVRTRLVFPVLISFFFALPQLCQAKGFVCEFCGNEKDIIFPFQLNKCQRCEGEPSLLVAGLGGSRAHSHRPSLPLIWRDWKISKPRRLARALSQDRREGEGGEEDLELNRGVKSGEERADTAEETLGTGGVFKDFTPGKLVKGNEDEQEITGGTESERERETKSDKGEEGGNGQHGEVYSTERAKSKEKGDRHSRREKINLLKVLHIERLKKNISKGDRRNSDSETCSSLESLDEVGQEKKGRWKVSGLSSLTKGFSKRETEHEQKTEVEEQIFLEKVTGTEEEGKAKKGPGENNEILDKGQTAEKPSTKNVEEFTLMKLLKPRQLLAVFSRESCKGEEDRNGESDIKREMDTEEEVVVTRSTWRGRKTRRARRGKKIWEETESQTEGGENAEIDDLDYCTAKGEGQE